MTYTKSVQYSGFSVRKDVEVRVFSRAVLKYYPERDYGLPRLGRAFSLLTRAAGYNKNTTVSSFDDEPGNTIGPVERRSTETVFSVEQSP